MDVLQGKGVTLFSKGLVVALVGIGIVGCGGQELPRCGDGVLGRGEICDGEDLGGRTCASLGYPAGGRLGCTPTCHLDPAGCLELVCGNDVIDPGEACDGEDLGGATCQSLGYRYGGLLHCQEDCSGLDPGWCNPIEQCGNGVREGQERCDGTDLGGESCVTLGYSEGELRCFPDCDAVSSGGCSGTPECGNSVAEGLEVCDGSDLRGVDCAALGFTGGGPVRCRADCAGLERTGCQGGCGNRVREGGEVCDGTDLGGVTCPDLGYPGGVPQCRGDCAALLVSSCGTWDATCGDGVRQGGEQCDGDDLGDYPTCEDVLRSGGPVRCDASCRLDFDLCTGDGCAAPALFNYYQDSVCSACEWYGGRRDPACDALCPVADGHCVSWRDRLAGASTCLLTTGSEDPDCGTCGDGQWAPGEACDGPDTWDCGDYGYVSGTPAGCDAACVIDLTGCAPHACGDGIACPHGVVSCAEECDDGNTVPGDGCDEACRLEVILESEPNDSLFAPDGPLPPTNGFQVAMEILGEIAPAGDADHFAITFAAQGFVRLRVTGLDEAGCLDGTVDPQVRLYGPPGLGFIDLNDDVDPGVDTCSDLTVGHDTGDHVIRVSASTWNAPQATFTYRLTVYQY